MYALLYNLSLRNNIQKIFLFTIFNTVLCKFNINSTLNSINQLHCNIYSHKLSPKNTINYFISFKKSEIVYVRFQCICENNLSLTEVFSNMRKNMKILSTYLKLHMLDAILFIIYVSTHHK